MSLLVEIPAGDSNSRFVAREVSLERCLGQPVQWRFVVQCQHDDPRVAFLAEALEGGQVKASPLWKDAPLGLDGIVVGISWSSSLLEHLIIDAQVTTLEAAPSPAPDPDPFTPRWRVHDGVQNLLKLIQKFAHVATVPTWVKNELEKVKFTPSDFTSVLQDGLSDWGFVCHLLDQYGALGAEAALKPLVLVGSLEEAEGKWLVTYGSKAAYDKLGDISNREVAPEDGTLAGIVFPTELTETALEARSRVVPLASRVWRSRKFTTSDWEKWAKKDLPLFTKGDQRFIHRVVDRLWPSDLDTLEWTTQLDPLAEGAVVAGPEPPVRLVPWIRIGEVSETQTKKSWIKVKLEGFEKDSETVQARLQEMYSGKNGTRGLHLVPENKTKVLLSWSGRFHEPILVIGNVREKDTEFDSPSVWLEALTTKQYVDILVKEVGKTTIESDYDVEVKKKTTLKSVDAYALTGDADTSITSTGALKVTGKDTTDLESTGALKIVGKNTTDVESTGALKLTGKATVDIAATGPFAIDAKATTDIKGTGPITVDGKAMTMIKGVAGVHLNP